MREEKSLKHLLKERLGGGTAMRRLFFLREERNYVKVSSFISDSEKEEDGKLYDVFGERRKGRDGNEENGDEEKEER